MSLDVGGSLDLRVPAVVDAKCNCFCFKKEPDAEEHVVVLNRTKSGFKARERADTDRTIEAVEAIFQQIVRELHPRFDLAQEVVGSCGFTLLHPPKALTLEQFNMIQRALKIADAKRTPKEEPLRRVNVTPEPEHSDAVYIPDER